MYAYDYLVVGAGLFGSVFSYMATQHGKKCLVIDRRDHIGGNCYTETIEDIDVHVYGAHIFRTSDRSIWEFMNQFCEFNHFVNSPIANYKGEIYNLPFNMNTFSKMWGISKPEEAQKIIKAQSSIITGTPQNLEEQAISLVGTDIYERLVKGYTEKQWGRPCNELPASIIRRLPVRFTYDNNYFNDSYQGIPKGGYTRIFCQLLEKSSIQLSVDFLDEKKELSSLAKTILYTGAIDAFYDYVFDPLEYRSLRFDHQIKETDNFQGVAVVNFTDAETPYTRSIEHKHFDFGVQEKTVVSYEYPFKWSLDVDPYYPIEDDVNRNRYLLYLKRAQKDQNIFFGGRLGEYRYYDMQDTIKSALNLAKRLIGPVV